MNQLLPAYTQLDLPDATILAFRDKSVPLEELGAINFNRGLAMGNTRNVYALGFKQDGTPIRDNAGKRTEIYLKSPERIFTTSDSLLRKGEIYWGGRRSWEKPLLLNDHVVEEQAEIEAAILSLLELADVPCEEPLGIYESHEGRKGLLTKGIEKGWINDHSLDKRCVAQVKSLEEKEGWVPHDFSSYNMVSDRGGVLHVIDVNRWIVPGLTDQIRLRLRALIQDRLQLNPVQTV